MDVEARKDKVAGLEAIKNKALKQYNNMQDKGE